MNCKHKARKDLLHLNDEAGNIIRKCELCDGWFNQEGTKQ